MHPSDNPLVASQLRNLIYYSLDNDLLQNALFHAGRLHGMDPRNGDAAHLMAMCHYRLGQYKAAYDYSREKGLRGQHLGCAYIFAQSCLVLQRHIDGINALERSRGFWAARNHWNKHTETSRRHVPDAAAVCFLLGKLWIAYGETTKAVEYFVESLKLNPFLWEAFTELCDNGANPRPSVIFKMTSEMLVSMEAIPSNPSAPEPTPTMPLQPHVNGNLNGMITPGHDPFNTKARSLTNLFGDSASNAQNSTSAEWETPPANGLQMDEDVLMDDANMDNEPPQAPSRHKRGLYPFTSDTVGDIPKMRSITTRSKAKAGSDISDASEVSARPTAIPVSQKRTISGQIANGGSSASTDPSGAPQRRSDRLLRSRILPSTSRLAAAVSRETESKEKRELRRAKTSITKGKSTSTVGRVVSGNRKAPDPADRDGKERPSSVASIAGSVKEIGRKPPPPTIDIQPQKDAIQFLFEQYIKLGSAYRSLTRYELRQALDFFDSLPSCFRETPWVLAAIGRAQFEKSSYAESEQAFLKVRKLAPSRTEDMEVYSTVLWHLKKDVELSYLAHELVELDRLSPQAWCALGNAFSLQGEHEQAVRCFRRATQLDPRFAYAFTLAGHEHVANEEFEKALLSFRNAIAADSRHYNGWYGLGQVFEKLGKYDAAREHYMNAVSINPLNPVLKVYIGLVLEKTKHRDLALQQYNEAVSIDPRSAKARFAKARVLLSLRRPEDALLELEMLKNLMPEDPKVHFLLGKVYKAVGERTASLKHFTIAMNLDPKAMNLIKEQLDDEGDGEGSEDEME